MQKKKEPDNEKTVCIFCTIVSNINIFISTISDLTFVSSSKKKKESESLEKSQFH